MNTQPKCKTDGNWTAIWNNEDGRKRRKNTVRLSAIQPALQACFCDALTFAGNFIDEQFHKHAYREFLLVMTCSFATFISRYQGLVYWWNLSHTNGILLSEKKSRMLNQMFNSNDEIRLLKSFLKNHNRHLFIIEDIISFVFGNQFFINMPQIHKTMIGTQMQFLQQMKVVQEFTYIRPKQLVIIKSRIKQWLQHKKSSSNALPLNLSTTINQTYFQGKANPKLVRRVLYGFNINPLTGLYLIYLIVMVKTMQHLNFKDVNLYLYNRSIKMFQLQSIIRTPIFLQFQVQAIIKTLILQQFQHINHRISNIQ